MGLVNWAFSGDHTAVHGPWTHGNWCGEGGSGVPTDRLDGACMAHDYCYFHHGLTVGMNYNNPVPDYGQGLALQQCNQNLCNAAPSSINDSKWVDRYFTWGVKPAYACTP